MCKHTLSPVCAEPLAPLGAEHRLELAVPVRGRLPTHPAPPPRVQVLLSMRPLALLPPLAPTLRLPVLTDHSLVLLLPRPSRSPLLALPVGKQAGSSVLAVPSLAPLLAQRCLVLGAHPARCGARLGAGASLVQLRVSVGELTGLSRTTIL